MNIRKRLTTREGFTIIELSLAMVFVSFLLISVVVVTIRMTDIYTKGNTVKAVTTVGRSLIADFKRVVGASPAPSALSPSSPSPIVFFIPDTDVAGGNNGNGRFCTGSYSYIWNTGPKIKEFDEKKAAGTATANVVTYNGNAVRLLKIPDTGRRYCSDDKVKLVLTNAQDPNGVDLIGTADVNLALYQLYASVIVDKNAGGQALYSISFVLGTISQSTTWSEDGSIDVANKQCTAPAGIKSEFNYCAINKFDILVKATGNKAD